MAMWSPGMCNIIYPVGCGGNFLAGLLTTAFVFDDGDMDKYIASPESNNNEYRCTDSRFFNPMHIEDITSESEYEKFLHVYKDSKFIVITPETLTRFSYILGLLKPALQQKIYEGDQPYDLEDVNTRIRQIIQHSANIHTLTERVDDYDKLIDRLEQYHISYHVISYEDLFINCSLYKLEEIVEFLFGINDEIVQVEYLKERIDEYNSRNIQLIQRFVELSEEQIIDIRQLSNTELKWKNI